MTAFGFDDSDDEECVEWPAGGNRPCAANLKQIDNMLQCPICNDIYNGDDTACMMLTQCGHNFCSQCIRRHFEDKRDCPECREAIKGNIDKALINNRTIDLLGVQFSQCRKQLCELVTNAEPLVKRDNEDNKSEMGSPSASTVSSKFVHRLGKAKKHASVVYNLKSIKNLRSMCKEAGLSSKGGKEILEWRHREYVRLYNANLDAIHPKELTEIAEQVKDIETEREKDKAFATGSGLFRKTGTRTRIAPKSGFVSLERDVQRRKKGGKAPERPNKRQKLNTGSIASSRAASASLTSSPSVIKSHGKSKVSWRVVWSEKRQALFYYNMLTETDRKSVV